MDSGNSGSMQSSSGGDEEYDSRAESISAFLNPQGHVGPLPTPPQPQPQHHHNHQTHSSAMFDPLSNYFDPLSSSRSVPLTNPNSLLNLDMVWSKTLRSDPNATDLGGLITSSSSTQNQALMTNQFGGQSRASAFPNIQIPPASENVPRASASASGISGSGANDQAAGSNSNVVRNPKKRSRASRRAPTTVLTTDTTNFRAMVQEFTGIPAPPFTSSPFSRSRLDLFGTASSLRSGHLEPAQPSYLMRPFAQKVQPPPFVSSSSPSSSTAPSNMSFPSSSMVDVLGSNSTSNASNSTSLNYQPSSDLGLLRQPHNLLNMNMQNPILNLQTLLQSPPKFPLSNSTILGSKPQGSLEISANDCHLKMGNVLEEFGLSHQHVSTQLSGLQNMVSSDGTLARSENNPPSNWSNDAGSNGGDQGLLRSLNGSYSNSERVTNGKLNYSAASSSDFHGDKGPENVATRSEGMVESWICSSD
ncbi:hypothetical protein CJ030_MR6G013333 [Morella rubra]|uniref:VQ domain-containing protein n=1 Tax=Morella rubra TaxID=262757 RepID=A0A6A1VBP2_9ROSI|nr:hypothetical protein CJ030_MR6G013333 [Morella rubra]